MKKIKTLFRRDFAQKGAPILNEYEVILPEDAIATRKYDGTAIKISHGRVWQRYDAKHGKLPPEGFEPCEIGPDLDGHWPGWLPVNFRSNETKWLRDAIPGNATLPDGTYELCGPHVNGNPERFGLHVLVPHGKDVLENVPRTFESLCEYLRWRDIEGIVWWHNGEPIAKIKRRDFGMKR